ncbi:hypothetical protein P691DRAFT_307150 [Macrolepiota fuliginosa MF-IS2]|uniref:Uncharacterized protein n=1 Tax=Macrolepiota fuliginosa MF-IS2 TaxID=1400762 RepID=A0A9P6BY53_9AGAR|nr:hypothetical protein P691DRAFT_307150 [Macrolepiota fuliginosa MF-IS2]
MGTDVLYELFGDGIDSLTKGPVWTYVFERKRAVEVWNTLMGNIDPECTGVEALTSSVHSTDSRVNKMRSWAPPTQTAEIHIVAFFASSPPFRSVDLPAETEADRQDTRGARRSVLQV